MWAYGPILMMEGNGEKENFMNEREAFAVEPWACIIIFYLLGKIHT